MRELRAAVLGPAPAPSAACPSCTLSPPPSPPPHLPPPAAATRIEELCLQAPGGGNGNGSGAAPPPLHSFEGQHLANLVYGMARCRGFRPAPHFLTALAAEAALRVGELKPQELFNITWAYSQVCVLLLLLRLADDVVMHLRPFIDPLCNSEA